MEEGIAYVIVVSEDTVLYIIHGIIFATDIVLDILENGFSIGGA